MILYIWKIYLKRLFIIEFFVHEKKGKALTLRFYNL